MATLAWRLRIRNATNTADELVITSLASNNPYIIEPPSGDGQTVNPVTGEVQVGGFTVSVIDAELAPGNRVVTGKLTDADGRQQLLSRRAVVEESENAGANWAVLVAGYVNAINLVSALRFVFTIGESRRAEQRIHVFERVEPGFERASCVLGGPIIGDFGPYADEGRPLFVVKAVTGEKVTLQWLGGPLLPPPIHENSPPIPEYNRNHILRVAAHYLGAEEAGGDTPFPDLICRLFATSTAAGAVSNPPPGLTTGTQDFVPLGHTVAFGAKGTRFGFGLINRDDQIVIRWPDAGTRPVAGARFKLAIFPRYIDERNPLHWQGHPIDFATGVLALRGESFNAASAAAVKAELGAELKIELRITKAMSLAEALETIVYGPFGVGARTNAAGEREFFATRRRPSVAPVQIISNDELTSDDGTPWGLEERSAVNKVSFKVQVFTPLDGGEPAAADADNPIDWLGVSSVTVEAVPVGQSLTDAQSVSYELPGGIMGMATGTTAVPGDLDRYVKGIGEELFDFQGRGAITSEIHVRRGVLTAQIGQEIILNLAHLPTASPAQSPTSQRGTVPRVAVILRRTPTPSGVTLKLQDRGIAPPIVLVPTFTIAQSALDATHRAAVTLTNAGTLAAAGCLIRVEMATGGAMPASGHTVRILDPAIDATVFDLPPVDPGSLVWARLRAEKHGQPAGPYSAFSSAALQALNAPTNLQGEVLDTVAELTWTVAHADRPVEVYFALNAEPAVRLGRVLLPAGSSQCRLQLPSGAVEYVFTVRHRENPPGLRASPAITLVLNGQPAVLLEPPADPCVFSDGDGVFGMEVVAGVRPTWVEFWVAEEAAPGSGIEGAYTLAATQQPQRTGYTSYELPKAANDGKLRFLKARHVRDGSTPSTFTVSLSVDPWKATAPTGFPFFRSASVWIDDFTGLIERRWKQLNEGEPAAGSFRIVHDPDARVGGSVGRATGWVHLEHADRVPYDPKLLTCIRYRVRQLRDPVAGGKKLFLGVNGFAERPGEPDVFAYINRAGANSPLNQHFVCADGVALEASREFTDFYAFFQGFAGGKVPLVASQVTQSGFTEFSAANLVDGDTNPAKVGFRADEAQPGAYVQLDFAEPVDLAEARMHMGGAGSRAQWQVSYADASSGPYSNVEE